MCGITGIFDTRLDRPIDRSVLARMNDAQFHRGPDEGSVHLEPGLGFGHRRLSIIDVATGQQPLFNEDGTVVIVHAWEAWGADCVKRLRGMFAFALWDRNRKTLFMARDRLGVKPMFYGTLGDGTLLFTSRVQRRRSAHRCGHLDPALWLRRQSQHTSVSRARRRLSQQRRRSGVP